MAFLKEAAQDGPTMGLFRKNGDLVIWWERREDQMKTLTSLGQWAASCPNG